MKRFEELTDEEVLALTQDEVTRWIDVECAHEGAPLLPPRPMAPTPIMFEPDVTVFLVGNIYFGSADDAAKAAALMAPMARFNVNYVSGPRFDKIAMPSCDDLTVSTVRAFSAERWDVIKSDMARYEELKKQFEADSLEYQKASERRDVIASDIHGRVERVRGQERRRARMREEFARYVDLAGGDQTIARRFLVAAHPDALDILPELAPAVDVSAPARES